MADDQRDLGALRAVADRDAEIARLPRLDRDPRVQFAVVDRDFAAIVDDKAAVVGIARRIPLHDREAAPDPLLAARLAERRDLGAVEPAHQRGVGAHREAVQRIFGKDDEVHGRHAAARLCHHRADLQGLRRQLGRRLDDRQLQLHQTEDDAVFALVEAAEAAHRAPSYLVIDNSAGAPTRVRFGEQVMTMISRVRM